METTIKTKLSPECQKIVDYMLTHNGSITNREIMTKLYINGATARISDLRKKGIIEDGPTHRTAEGKHYKEYILKGY